MTIGRSILFAVCVVLCGCAGAPTSGDPETITGDRAAAEVAQFLSGWMTSEAQSKSDPTYFNVHLVGVPIWTERTDGHWLYVEQAVADFLDRPYRQRIYHVFSDGEQVVSEIYTIPQPEAWVAVWEDPAVIATLAPEDLTKKDGCAVRLNRRSPGVYEGETGVGTCLSTRSGAAYATSEVILTDDHLESWDRGFDEAGVQVWGATEGAYVFRRISDEPRKSGAP